MLAQGSTQHVHDVDILTRFFEIFSVGPKKKSQMRCFKPNPGEIVVSNSSESFSIRSGFVQACTQPFGAPFLEAVGVFGLMGDNLVVIKDYSVVTTIGGKRIFKASLHVVDAGQDDQLQKFLEQFEFHWSPDFDFTHTMQRLSMNPKSVDRRFFWNAHVASKFLDAGCRSLVIPVVDAFVGCIQTFKCQYAIISRRGRRRQGVRYRVRGADLLGNVANFVETEQIVCNNDGIALSSFVQVRGSIPVIWQQKGDGEMMPQPRVTFVPMWKIAHDKHWEDLQASYGASNLVAVNLVDQHGPEAAVGHAYEIAVRAWNARHARDPSSCIRYMWYDFHTECKGNRYDVLPAFAETVVQTDSRHAFFCPIKSMVQVGVIRTNCIDCLDRTNVVQSVIARRILGDQLRAIGCADAWDASAEAQFKHIWADNADAMSKRYTGVGALKTDYTRSGKRSGKGVVQDGLKSVQRIAQHMFKDGEKQALMDLLHGIVRLQSAGQQPMANCLGSFATNTTRIDVYPGVMVQTEPPYEQVFSLSHIFSIGRTTEKGFGVKVWFRSNPEPLKLVFPTYLVREKFIETVLPQMPPAPSHADMLLVSWKNPQLEECSATTPDASFRLAHALFGKLPRTPSIVALSTQGANFVIPLDDPFIESKGLSAASYLVFLLQLYLGGSHELLQHVEGPRGTSLAIFVRYDWMPYVDASYHCEVVIPPAKASITSLLQKNKSIGVGVGCAAMLSLGGKVPITFVCSAEGCGDDKYFLKYVGAQSAHFEPFNMTCGASHTFWMGTLNPFQGPVSSFVGLAMHSSLGFILASSASVSGLLSSDPVLASDQGHAGPTRMVACSFKIAVDSIRHPSGQVQLALWNMQVIFTDSTFATVDAQLHLEFWSVQMPEFGPISTAASRDASWRSTTLVPLVIDEAFNGRYCLQVALMRERNVMARGSIVVTTGPANTTNTLLYDHRTQPVASLSVSFQEKKK